MPWQWRFDKISSIFLVDTEFIWHLIPNWTIESLPNQFYCRIATLLWLDVSNYLTSFNQPECFNSLYLWHQLTASLNLEWTVCLFLYSLCPTTVHSSTPTWLPPRISRWSISIIRSASARDTTRSVLRIAIKTGCALIFGYSMFK